MFSFSADSRAAELEMRAILFVLLAFAHVDGVFDERERSFVRDTIDALVEQRARESFGGDLGAIAGFVPRYKAHFYHAAAGIEYEIRSLTTESVAQGETPAQFVRARLELRCFELLERLDEKNRAALLAMVDELMHVDGIEHPAERAFRHDLEALLGEEPTRIAAPPPRRGQAATFVIDDARTLPVRRAEHPFFAAAETPFSPDPQTFARQAAGDVDLVARFENKLWEMRARGQNKLAGAKSFEHFAGQEPFVDGFVHVFPARPGVEHDLTVIGDLHGCYACLKAALLQVDFFGKVEAYRADPARNPLPLLVFLGDYIDRGLYSFDGVLRAVLRLFLAAPEHVFVLRGNHEHLLERDGRVLSPVRPAEAIDGIAFTAPRELLAAYMHLFDALPSVLVFDRFLFAHAGIPRDDTASQKLKGPASLNDPEIRLQMAWSDPSDADFVPLELQKSNTRFAFGRMQFRAFMARMGCTVMIRGHERVVEGFRRVYSDPDATLLSLFSAGGSGNDDLPASSNYREVTPMALAVRHKDGQSRITPFAIAYERYGDPAHNAFRAARS
jgi:hypothetical protein